MSVYKINVDLLSNYKESFINEINYFKNTSYNSFKNSYLNNCSDYTVQAMMRNLEMLYKKIDNGYTNLNNWWSNYLDNAKSLENYMMGNVSVGAINESAIRAIAISKLKELPVYEIKYSGTFTTSNTMPRINMGGTSNNVLDNNKS